MAALLDNWLRGCGAPTGAAGSGPGSILLLGQQGVGAFSPAELVALRQHNMPELVAGYIAAAVCCIISRSTLWYLVRL